MGKAQEIQSLRRNQQKLGHQANIVCEITDSKYTALVTKENLFLKMGSKTNRVIRCKRYSGSEYTNF